MKIYLNNDNAVIPIKGTEGAAGWDLYSSENKIIRPSERCSVKTGISLEIPKGNFGSIRPRSGLAVKYGIDTMAGVIDSDYRGEVAVVLVNLGEFDFEIKVKDRIAQIIIQPCLDLSIELSRRLNSTQRGNNGFGSTG